MMAGRVRVWAVAAWRDEDVQRGSPSKKRNKRLYERHLPGDTGQRKLKPKTAQTAASQSEKIFEDGLGEGIKKGGLLTFTQSADLKEGRTLRGGFRNKG